MWACKLRWHLRVFEKQSISASISYKLRINFKKAKTGNKDLQNYTCQKVLFKDCNQ